MNISPLQLADSRTIQLIKTYLVYENNPMSAFDKKYYIWFEAIQTLKGAIPRL